MIDSLGSLFRYNLKMSEPVVMLERELKVVEDYMFIQQMRFGRRVVYESRLELDPGTVMIPAFTLQPLVENAVIHGLAKKEEGGRVFLDESLKRFDIVYPACGSSNSAVELTIAQLEQCSGYEQWVDVCKGDG